MRKKILSIVLTCVMIIGLMPTLAFAGLTQETDGNVETTPVAKIGDQEYTTLADAVGAVTEEATTIELLSDVTLTGDGVDVDGKNITINGNNKTISISRVAFNHRDASNRDGLLTGSLTVNDAKFVYTGDNKPQGYAVLIGFNSTFDITLDDCTFKDMYTAVLANPRTAESDDIESITIKNCTYDGTTWGYSIDDLTAGALTYDKQAAVTFTKNTGLAKDHEMENFGQVAAIGTVRYKTLDAAVAAVSDGEAATIELLSDITLTGDGVDVNGKNITINGNNKTISISRVAFNHKDASNLDGLLTGSLTVNNAKFVYTGADKPQGYAVLIGFNSTFDITLDDCTFKDMYTAVLANPRTTEIDDIESITIKNCTYDGTTWGYSIDDLTAGALTYEKQAIVTFTDNTGITAAAEMEIFPAQVASVGTTRYTDLNTAINAAENGTVKLLKDATLPANVSKAVTIDLSGHKITAKTGADTPSAFTLKGEDSLTFSGEETAVFTTESGSFEGPAAATVENTDSIGTLNLAGGVFSADPAAYLPSGKVSVANTDSETKAQYPYAVSDVNTDVKVVPAGAEAKTGDTEGKGEKEVEAMNSAATAIKAENAVTVSGLDSVGGNEAVNIKAEDITSATEALKAENVKVADGATVTVYVQPYLDITVADAKVETAAEGGATTLKELTLDIKPMVKEIASTASSASEIVTKATDQKTQNAVEIGTAKEVEVTTPVTITFALPAGFVTSTDAPIYIKHQKENGKVYVYTATVTSDSSSPAQYYATFTNPNGFSEFVVTVANPSAAKVGETGYINLQAAVDAVENGGTITILSDVSGQTATVSRTVDFKVAVTEGKNFDTSSIKAGDNTKLTLTGEAAPYNYSFVYTKPSSSSSSSTADVKVEINVNGEIGFVDVDSSDYFYNPVLWAVSKDITKGVDNTHFAPDGDCTRAQIVTFLWRAAGSPAATAAAKFSDVSAGSYYASAVAWAVEKGITTGTSADKFSPDAACTRAQAVTFLARALNGSAAPTSQFTDVAADSYYASAVAWAKANGITTGTSADKFSPDADCTRAQIVSFLYRAYEGK